MLAEKKQKGKKRKEKAMRKRIFAAFVCLCMLMALVPSMAYAGDTVSVGGLCEHHTQHDDACGYSEGTAEVPCSHEHTEECYTQATKCVHEHMAECYSGETTEPICGHVCSEESGCITKELNCNHEHDENCGYVPAKEETPCNFVCEICNAQVAEEPECICDTKCTEEEPNADCPVCGGENGDISGCVGAASAMLFSPMSTRSIIPAKPLGNGTEENPYQIGTAEQLYWFAGMVNGTLTDGTAQNTGAWAELTADIIIPEGETWISIGNCESYSSTNPYYETVPYKGTFDGNGYTISNLYFNMEGSRSGGLFGYIDIDGTVKNVGILDSVINHRSPSSSIYNIYTDHVGAGGICSYNNGTIENCYSTAKVINSNKSNSLDKVGGVCGYNGGTVKNCYNTGTVSSDGNSYIGGVCGYNDGTIINCYNTGEVSDASIDLSYVGGICGYNHGTMTNCYFLTGTAENAIKTDDGTATKVEEKGESAFSSGEVTWLLDK